jgi:distribution and morphology protein 31
LLDATSDQVYAALAHHVTSHDMNNQRLKQVGVWSLQLAAELAVGTVRKVLLQRKDLGLGDWGVGLAF